MGTIRASSRKCACALAIALVTASASQIALAQQPPPPPAQNPVQYGDGGVYGNITVVPVFWTNQVAADVQAGIVASTYAALGATGILAEYDKGGQTLESGGTVLNPITITPTQSPTCTGSGVSCSASSPCQDGTNCVGGKCTGSGGACGPSAPCATGAGVCNLTNLQVGAELTNQMNSGLIPVANAAHRYVYTVYFPRGIDGVELAALGEHWVGTIGTEVPFTYPFTAVLNGARSGSVLRSAASPYQQLTETASHELFETMTDPFPYSPYGWIVPGGSYTGDEIGDLCTAHPALLPGGVSLQKTWSNSYNECVTGEAWIAPSFTRFVGDSGMTMGLFWATGDGGIAATYSNGQGTWSAASEIPGSNVASAGYTCRTFETLSGPSPIDNTCFEGGNPVTAVSAGNTGVIKVFGAMAGTLNELVIGPSGPIVKTPPLTNYYDTGGGYPVAAADAQLGGGEVRLAWTSNSGAVNVVLLNNDDTVAEEAALAPANSAVPGSTVSMIVPAPGKAMLFWAKNGVIYELIYDCYGQTSCAKGAGTWTGPAAVDLVAGVVPGSTVTVVSPSPGNISLFWTKQSLSVGSIWTKSFNYLTGWTGDTDLYDEFGAPVQVGDAMPGANVTAVSTTSGGISLFWPALSGGGIFTGVLPPGHGTTAFGPPQFVTSTAVAIGGTVITAVPNLNGVDKEVSLFWQSQSPSSFSRVGTAHLPGTSGQPWSGVTSLGGVSMVP